jgi:hypothetical protein
MGGILSSQATTIAVTEVPPKQTTVEESNPTDTAQTTTTLAAETMSQTVTEPSTEAVVHTTTDVKAETEQSSVETRPEEVLERYIEPSGTKVEVAPVAVAPAVDVVKKGKKKNKKHH